MALDPLNYKRVQNQVLDLAGIDSDTLPTVEWRLIRNFASRRVKFCWEAAKWPEVCIQEQRTITQSGGDEGNYVALNQSGQTEIGEVFAVWNKSPKSNQDLTELTWYLSENGIQIAEANTTAYFWFRKVPPEFTGNLYSTTASYTTGDQCYDNTIGQFYTANQSVAAGSNSPSDQPSYWDVVSVPHFMQDYIIRGTFADYLRHNQDLDRARVAEKDATALLDIELMKLHTQEGQTTRLGVNSY